jgi:hypothetical protein
VNKTFRYHSNCFRRRTPAFIGGILFFLVSLSGIAQGFRSREYLPGCTDHMARAVFETSPGNYIAAGFSTDTIEHIGLTRLTIMGLDSAGKIKWTKRYGTKKFAYLNNTFISRTFIKHGNFLYYAGCVTDTTGKYFGALIKFNLSGDTLWQRLYRTTDPKEDVIPQFVTPTIDNGFLLTGFFQHWTLNYRKCLVIKTDASGKELWRKKVGKAPPDVQDGKVIIQDSATKKIVITGYQYLTTAGHYDNLLILDSLGNKLSQHTFCSYGALIKEMIRTDDKKFLLLGAVYSSVTVGGYPLMNSFALKFDLANPSVPIWRIDNFDRRTFANGFLCGKYLLNGNLLIGGYLDTMEVKGETTDCLFRFTLLDKNGALINNKYYNYKPSLTNNPSYEGSYSLELTSDAGFVISLAYSGNSNNPFAFVKYDSTGCDSSLAYCASISSIKNTEDDYSLRVFPSPAIDEMTVLFNQQSQPNGLAVHIINSVGQIVMTETILPGALSHSFTIRELPEGLYFLRAGSADRWVNKPFVISR